MENLCAPLLANGLYKTFNIEKKTDFESDFKSYLESSEFKKDFEEKKWNLGIDAIIEDVPIGLTASSSDNEIDEFQQKIKTSKKFNLKEDFFLKTSISIPDVELAKVYTDCVIRTAAQFGFTINVNVSEKDLFFLINYRPLNVTDPMPIVKDLLVKGAKNIKASFEISGSLIEQNTISCDRDGDQDVVLLLTTDKGSLPYRVPANPSGFNKDFPVGTIITSFLTWKEFQNVTKNNMNNPDGDIWNSKYSKWGPCDGRIVEEECGFFRATGSLTSLPDLRGLFLRGYNVIDNDEATSGINPISNEQKDPDNRIRGRFQLDMFKSHNHSVQGPATIGNLVDGSVNFFNEPVRRDTAIQTNYSGGDETRPKNMAVYYYIRIN